MKESDLTEESLYRFMAESQTIWDTQDAIVSRNKDKELNTRPPSGVTVSGVIHTTKIIAPAFKNEIKQFKDDEPARLSRAVPVTPPPGCCLYPWPDPGSPLYPTTGLPSAIVETEGFYNGGSPETYTHDVGTYKFTAASGRYIEAELGTGLWSWYDSLGSFLNKWSACLIGAWEVGSTPMVIEDQFLTNYQLDFDEGATHHTFTMARVVDDHCSWLDTIGEGITLSYNDVNYKFEITLTGGATKNDPQSSPVGTYTPGGGSAYTNIVVS